MALGLISFPAFTRSRKSQRPYRHSGRKNTLPECPAYDMERFSSPSSFDYGVESFEFGAGLGGSELPINRLTGSIAFLLPGPGLVS